MGIKLIAIDLDGTLLDSNRMVSEENFDAIQEAKAAGIKVVLCTGRPLRSMSYLLDEVGLKSEEDLAITYNGGLIQKTNTGEIVHEITLTRDDCLAIYELSQLLNLPVNFIDLDFVYEPTYPVGRESIYNKGLTNIPADQALQFSNIDIQDLPNPFTINKAVMSRPAHELDEVISKIPKEFHEKFNIYKSQDTILEILPQNVDKGHAMRIVGEMLNLDKSEIMGIGDQENDLSLVQQAGVGVAMGNAIDIVKESATYITKTNDESGVAHAIRKIALQSQNL